MWQLKLSINKCSVISFNLNSELIPFQYSILNQSLNRVSSIKDLGILFSSNLNFSGHIDTVCKTARVRSELILKCFSSRDKVLLFKAFLTYVRPLLEYCCNVWSPYKLADIKQTRINPTKFY